MYKGVLEYTRVGNLIWIEFTRKPRKRAGYDECAANYSKRGLRNLSTALLVRQDKTYLAYMSIWRHAHKITFSAKSTNATTTEKYEKYQAQEKL